MKIWLKIDFTKQVKSVKWFFKIAKNIGSGMATIETIIWKQKWNNFEFWINYLRPVMAR